MVDRWLAGIEALIANNGQAIVSTDDETAAISSSGHSPTQCTPTEHSDGAVVSVEEAIQQMTVGSQWTLLEELSDTVDVTTRSVQLRYLPPTAAEPFGSFSVDGGTVLPFHWLSEVFLGPQSATFLALTAGREVDESCCVTLLFDAAEDRGSSGGCEQLDLMAADEATLNTWLVGINHLMSQREEQQSTTEPQPQPMKETEATDDDLDEELTGPQCVQEMQRGTPLTLFSLVDERVEAERIHLPVQQRCGGQPRHTRLRPQDDAAIHVD